MISTYFCCKKNTKKEHEIAIFYAQKINNEIKLTDLCMLLSHLSLICSLWKKIIRLTSSAYDKKNLASLIKNVMNNNLFFSRIVERDVIMSFKITSKKPIVWCEIKLPVRT